VLGNDVPVVDADDVSRDERIVNRPPVARGRTSGSTPTRLPIVFHDSPTVTR
jgi:hypothetical protein